MGRLTSKAIRRKKRDAKRAARRAMAMPALTSDLGKEQWAMATRDSQLIHFGCTYDEALQLAQKHGGTVMTDAAANRMRGFNELASQ